MHGEKNKTKQKTKILAETTNEKDSKKQKSHIILKLGKIANSIEFSRNYLFKWKEMQILNGTCFCLSFIFSVNNRKEYKLTDFKFFLSNFRQLQKTKCKKSNFLETKAVYPVIFAINRKETSEVNVKTFEGSFAQSKTFFKKNKTKKTALNKISLEKFTFTF